MKFLLVFLVVLVLAWRWRTWRDASQRQEKQDNPATPDAIGMVSCQHCGLHFPAHDAVTGKLGSYCSVAHRSSKEP